MFHNGDHKVLPEPRESFSAPSIDEELPIRPRILITGAMGQLGQGLAKLLRQKYGRENVVMSDIVKLNGTKQKDQYAFNSWMVSHHQESQKNSMQRVSEDQLDCSISVLPVQQSPFWHSQKVPCISCMSLKDPYLYLDVLDQSGLNAVVVNYQIDWLIHFSALLSAVGENNVLKALKLNVDGVNNVLEAARQYKLRIFIPSTIGAFGPSSPKNATPDVTIQRPRTIYGVTKVYNELIGEYYNTRFGVDFRCLRLPGVISGDTQPGGGTTDYAVQMFHDAVKIGRHVCYLKPDTRLPMIYIDDCLRLIAEFMQTAEQNLKLRTYNATSVSFTPEELAREIQKIIPSFEISYDICPIRQAIADSWPQTLDDSKARVDWGWAPSFDLISMVHRMLQVLTIDKSQKLNGPTISTKSNSNKD